MEMSDNSFAVQFPKIFFVNSKGNQGVAEILEYLREDGDVMPWEKEIQKHA